MILTLTIALFFAQAKTVEDRLKELDEKLSSLEKKQRTLADENQSLEKKIADANAWREKAAVQAGAAWVKRHGGAMSLTEKQAADLEALWAGWTREDFQKRTDEAIWKTREATLREKLTAEQIPLLERSVRLELESSAKGTLTMWVRQAEIAPERSDAFVKTVMARLSAPEAGLIPQAHPGAFISWTHIHSAVEASGTDLAAVLTADEKSRLAKVQAQWNQFRQKEK